MFNSKRIRKVEDRVDDVRAKLSRTNLVCNGGMGWRTVTTWVTAERIEAIEKALGLEWVGDNTTTIKAHHEKINKGKK